MISLTITTARNCTIRCLAAGLLLMLGGCTSILTGLVVKPAVGNLQKQQDVELVCEGAPAYLLMIDSLIESDPANRELLLLGTQSYSGATAALTACDAAPGRTEAISLKAKHYGKRLLTTLLPVEINNSEEFRDTLGSIVPADAPYLFWGAFGWLTWIQRQQGSPASMVDLIVVENIMAHVLKSDETVENGSSHLFFGALYGAKPAMIGGDPKRSRAHFERALTLSSRSFLIVQTTYAETYCRMTFNKELHDALLKEVLEFPLERAPDNTLTNQIAKRKARALLEENFF